MLFRSIEYTAYYEEHREEIELELEAKREARVVARRANARRYYAEHKELIREQVAARAWKRKGYDAEYLEKNRERINARKKRRYSKYPEAVLARVNARRALIVGATVGNLAEIEEIYRKAHEEKVIRCYLCGKLIPMGKRHVDHIVPISKNGSHRPSNLAVACERCNLQKHDKMPEEIGLLV